MRKENDKGYWWRKLGFLNIFLGIILIVISFFLLNGFIWSSRDDFAACLVGITGMIVFISATMGYISDRRKYKKLV